jgi:putative nucleotidyltransferase with HDIG domain
MRLHTRARQVKDATAEPEVSGRRLYDALGRNLRRIASPELAKRLWWATEVVLLAAAMGAAALLGRSDEWRPLPLVGLLLALVVAGHWLSVNVRARRLNASLVALVLAMSLLGPAPAVAFGIVAMALTSAMRHLRPAQWLNNFSTFAVFLFVGGWTVQQLAGDVHDPRNLHLTRSVTFGLIVLGMYLLTLGLNFVLVALDVWIDGGHSLARQTRELLIPMLSGQLATGALATVLAVAYTNSGLPVLFGSIVLLLIFRHLTVALLRSEDRADQLEARSIQLASLQFGVLATLMNALALRDRTTSRHATAVARYAKALAAEAGCSEGEQEVIHTAALLHDIGKFTWSDRVLHPQQLTDEDWAVIRRHPQDGATLVGKLDGYGPVADAILYHHERVDGGGYPAGLIGSEIPLASRIIAICSTYDTMTARETYNTPMKPEPAIQEMRQIAGHQLDAELVDRFIALLEREGATIAGEDADFETELALERRVREMAQPTGR